MFEVDEERIRETARALESVSDDVLIRGFYAVCARVQRKEPLTNEGFEHQTALFGEMARRYFTLQTGIKVVLER